MPSAPDFVRHWGAKIPPAYPLITWAIRLRRWVGRPGVARGRRVQAGDAQLGTGGLFMDVYQLGAISETTGSHGEEQ